MKKTLTIIKISFALTVALAVGIWFVDSISLLNKKADAIELMMDKNPSNQTEVIDKSEEVNTFTTKKDNLPLGGIASASELPIEQVEKKPFSEELFYELAILFEAPIYWAIADNDVLVDFNSIDQLVTEFYTDFANFDLAMNFAYSFFYEEGNQVRLMPGQLPILFQMDKDFEMVQISENEFKVKQADKGYDGSIIYLVFDFKYDEENKAWKIENILYE